MTVKEALADRVRFIRRPVWNDEAYLELPLMDNGQHGIWCTLYDRPSCEAMGIENGSQQMAVWDVEADGADDWQAATPTSPQGGTP